MTTTRRSKSLQRTAVTVLIGLWGVSPVACGGRSGTLEGEGFAAGGLGSTSGGVDNFGGGPIGPGGGPVVGGAPSVGGGFFQGGRFGSGGAPTAGGRFGSGGVPTAGGRFGSGGARTSGGMFTSGGSTPVTGGKSGKGGAGGKGGSGGWDGGAAGGGTAGWDGGGAGGSGGEICPGNLGFTVYVDPLAGNDSDVGDIRPTGAFYPPECRYKTLTKALGQVLMGGQVIAVNDGASHPVTFKSESFPLTIPRHVTLSGVATGGPSDRFQIAFTSPGAPGVVLDDGATLEGFEIHNRGSGRGPLLVCDSPRSVAVNQVTLQGYRSTLVGASLGCTASVSNLNVFGAEVGVEVRPSPRDPRVSIQSGYISDCAVGVRTSGLLEVASVSFENNGDGLVVDSGLASVWTSTITGSTTGRAPSAGGNGVVVTDGELTITGSMISSNVGAGVYMDGGGSLSLVDSTVSFSGTRRGAAGPLLTGSGVYVEQAEVVELISSQLSENGMDGLHLRSAGTLGSLNLDSAALLQNAQSGAQLDGAIKNFSSVYSTFTENGVTGLVFNGAIQLGQFYGNWFIMNVGSQLTFKGPSPTGTWVLGSAVPGCTQPNLIACYQSPTNGVVAGPGVAVDIGYARWNVIPPVAGQDYTGSVAVHDTCGTSTLCNF